MSRAVFIPNRKYWIIIKNKRYDELRQLAGWEGFQDIPNVDNDAVNAKKGFKELGANLTEISIYEDVNFKEFKEIMHGLQTKIIQNYEGGKQKSLCFVYFAGHGVMDNTTYAVCNEGTKSSKILYPLQQRLKSLSQLPGAYVCGIFDCCREAISPAMRGGFKSAPDDDFDGDDYINHIFWFGCAENSGVAANSDIAVEFFRQMRKVANPADGSVTLPNDMLYWEPGDGGNML